MVDVPLEPRRSQVILSGDAPSLSPVKEMPLTLAAGLTRVPLELKVRSPAALAEATGSWIRLPDVEMLAPTMLYCPAAVAETVVPVMPAAVSAFVSAVA